MCACIIGSIGNNWMKNRKTVCSDGSHELITPLLNDPPGVIRWELCVTTANYVTVHCNLCAGNNDNGLN